MSELFEGLVLKRKEIAAAMARSAIQEAVNEDEMLARAQELARRQPELSGEIVRLGRFLRDGKRAEMDSVVLGLDTDGAQIVAIPRTIGKGLGGFDYVAISEQGERTELGEDGFALDGGMSTETGVVLLIKSGSASWTDLRGMETAPDIHALEQAEDAYKDADQLLKTIWDSVWNDDLNPTLHLRAYESIRA